MVCECAHNGNGKFLHDLLKLLLLQTVAISGKIHTSKQTNKMEYETVTTGPAMVGIHV